MKPPLIIDRGFFSRICLYTAKLFLTLTPLINRSEKWVKIVAQFKLQEFSPNQPSKDPKFSDTWGKVYSDSKQMTITNAPFTTISGHFSANCMFIFHKNEVQTVILMCLTGLKSNWFKGYDTKCEYFHFLFFCNFVPKN